MNENQTFLLANIRARLDAAYQTNRLPLLEMLACEAKDETLLHLYSIMVGIPARPVGADENIGS